MKNIISTIKPYLQTAREQKKLFYYIVLPLSLIFCCLLFSISGMFVSALGSRAQTISSLDTIQKGLSKQLIRLHVVANSDSDYDQSIKLQVKDGIVTYLQTFLSDVASKEESMDQIKEHLDLIEQKANELLLSLGITYTAKVTLGTAMFPIKVYGDITLPAGEYDALRIELGNVLGKNWWCIVFPNLCYVDATYQVVPEASKAKLKYLLTEEEYEAITSIDSDITVDNKTTTVVVKFKLWEWLKNLFS